MTDCTDGHEWEIILGRSKADCKVENCQEKLSLNQVVAMLNEHAALKQALSEAASEIHCAGPVAHRIRILKKEHGEQVAQLEDMLAIYKVLRNAHKSYRRTLAHEVSAIRQLLDGGTALALVTIEEQEGEIIKFKTELADYKKHFEPQMIQIRLLGQAEGEQSKTYKVMGDEGK